MNALGRAIEAAWADFDARSEREPELMSRFVVGALTPASAVFRAAVGLRRALYRARWLKAVRVPVPVVVVGNLTVGGAGKTPLVVALAAALREAGLKPGVVSRGHGGTLARHSNAEVVIDTGDEAAAVYGDEAVLIRRRSGVPVCVGRRRAKAAQALLAAHPEVNVIIADDGLQHYGLARDFEIAVFDVRGTGNGRMLPAGPLREPLARLAEVDAVVLNGDGAELPDLPRGVALLHAPYRMRLCAGEVYRLHDPAEHRSLDQFRGRRITAAAGIGNPGRFFALLSASGLTYHRLPLPDHYDYRDNPFAKRNAEAILITEKDAVKCAALDERRLWVVPVRAEIDAALVDAILTKIAVHRLSLPESSLASP